MARLSKPRVSPAPGSAPHSPHLPALETLARLLDDAIPIPFTRWRFGLDAILGLIPGVGDIVAALLGGLILVAAVHARVPGVIVARMALVLLADAALGLIPIAGDVADLFVKSNRRNLETLRLHAGGTRRPAFADYAIVGGTLLALLVGIILIVVAGVWIAGRIGSVLFSKPA
jgi:Domain of unknown function (DUF4112)